MKRSPTISAVIATCNRRELLARTLPTVFNQDFPPDGYEVIVVVDGSTDGTTEFLHALTPPCDFRVIQQSNQGKPIAVNAGVGAATGRLILFLDDDIFCDRSMLAEHVAAHGDGEPTLAFGPIIESPASPWAVEIEAIRRFDRGYYEPLQQGERAIGLEYACASPNSSVPRSIFLACGGHAKSLRRLEDVELGFRLWRAGCQLKFLPKAITYHLSTKSRGEIERDTKLEGKGLMTICLMHPEFRTHTVLAGILNGASWKRPLYWVVAHLPFSIGGLLAVPLWMIERLARDYPPLLRAAIHLHYRRSDLIRLQGAVAEAGSWQKFEQVLGRRLPVLLYHRVGSRSSAEAPDLTIGKEKFESQIRWLTRHGYTSIRPSDWLAWIRKGKALPEKPVLVTFDDAYADLTEGALPILKRYGFCGAVYVVTGCVGGKNSWDRVEWGDHLQVMTAEQIRYWASQGIEFGAHSRRHPLLTHLDESGLKREVEGSAEDLAQILGTRAASFAYPFGEYNEAAQQCVEKTFDLAFSCDEGLNDLTTNLHRLRRTGVGPSETLPEFSARVRLGYNPMEKLRARLAFRPRSKQVARLPVLMYHHVGPARPGTYPELTVSPKRFERQVSWLARQGYTGICPADWLKWRREGTGLPEKPIILTFDDGYADLAEHAFPVLRRQGFGAVVFIVTGFVGTTNAWDEASGSASHRLLSAEQIRYWAAQGIEFGSHTRTHPDLRTLTADELANEIVGSRDDLASLLGTPVTSFAYPFGFFNHAVYERARKAYDLTFRADEEPPVINYFCTDPHALQRLMVHPGDSLIDLACRLRWGRSPIQDLRARLRLRSRLKHMLHFVFG